MRLVLFLASLAAILTGVPAPELRHQKSVRSQKTTIKGRIWDSWTPFFSPYALPPVPENHKYTFILTRYPMSVPKKVSYRGDKYYKDKWRNRLGRTTMRGNRMITQVGESLRSRYKRFIDTKARMTKVSWKKEQVLLTTSEPEDPKALRNRAEDSANYLQRGLFSVTYYNGDRSTYVFGEHYDKSLQLMQCNYWKQMRVAFNSPTTELLLLKDFRHSCKKDLYSWVQTHVTMDPHNPWYVNNPESLYELFEMVLFESAQHRHELEWLETQFGALRSCVQDYFTTFLNTKNVLKIILEPMLHKMKMEAETTTVKMHMHLTDDVTYFAMLFYTQFLWKTPTSSLQWPNYGDALVFDFDINNNVQISRFSNLDNSESEKSYSFDTPPVATSILFSIVGQNSEQRWTELCSQDFKLYTGWTYNKKNNTLTERIDFYSQLNDEIVVSNKDMMQWWIKYPGARLESKTVNHVPTSPPAAGTAPAPGSSGTSDYRSNSGIQRIPSHTNHDHGARVPSQPPQHQPSRQYSYQQEGKLGPSQSPGLGSGYRSDSWRDPPGGTGYRNEPQETPPGGTGYRSEPQKTPPGGTRYPLGATGHGYGPGGYHSDGAGYSKPVPTWEDKGRPGYGSNSNIGGSGRLGGNYDGSRSRPPYQSKPVAQASALTLTSGDFLTDEEIARMYPVDSGRPDNGAYGGHGDPHKGLSSTSFPYGDPPHATSDYTPPAKVPPPAASEYPYPTRTSSANFKGQSYGLPNKGASAYGTDPLADALGKGDYELCEEQTVARTVDEFSKKYPSRGYMLLWWDEFKCNLIFVSDDQVERWRDQNPEETLTPHIISHTPSG